MSARSPSMALVALALAATATACGASLRPEPPSGAVDPGSAGLASPSDGSPTTRPDQSAASIGLPGAAALGLGSPVSPPSRPAPAPENERVGEASGKIVMTREHCETLGRKFAELAGEPTAGSRVGKTFAEQCSRDLAGQAVEAGEYQCMLRARAAEQLTSCRR